MNFKHFTIAILLWALITPPILASLNDGLVAYYPFNGNTHDESGNENHGIVQGATLTQDRVGNEDGAYQFNGISDYISIPDTDKIDFARSDDFSMVTWIKVVYFQDDIETGDNDIIEKWTRGSGYSYVIRYLNQKQGSNHGKIYVGRFDNFNGPRVISKKVINDDQFHQIAFIKAGSTLYLYIDGVLDGTSIDTTTGNTTNNSSLFLGRRGANNPMDNFFKGAIDELRIYDCALAAEEVQQLYSPTPSSGCCVIKIDGQEQFCTAVESRPECQSVAKSEANRQGILPKRRVSYAYGATGECDECEDREQDIPLFINLSSFQATPIDNSVHLNWITNAELDNAGFRMWRAVEQDNGQYEVNLLQEVSNDILVSLQPQCSKIITGQLEISNVKKYIPAAGNLNEATCYSFTDTSITQDNTYYYVLEDIDVFGNNTVHCSKLAAVTIGQSKMSDLNMAKNRAKAFCEAAVK